MPDIDNAPAHAEPEADDVRSERRAKEFAALLAVHKESVAAAHKMYPVRLDVKFTDMPPDERQRYNQLRAEISSANRAYWRQVREAHGLHLQEENKLIAEHLERASKVEPTPHPAEEAV
jgi:hypothetical protein